MAELSSKSAPVDTEQRSNSLRAFLFTLVLTPFLLLPEPVREIVSVEATVAAVSVGVLAGIAMSVVLGRYQFDSQNDVRTTIVALVSTGVATIVLWLLLPTALFQTVPHFGLAFTWSFSLVSVTRDVILPKAMGGGDMHE